MAKRAEDVIDVSAFIDVSVHFHYLLFHSVSALLINRNTSIFWKSSDSFGALALETQHN
jgi:hypothetical protein